MYGHTSVTSPFTGVKAMPLSTLHNAFPLSVIMKYKKAITAMKADDLKTLLFKVFGSTGSCFMYVLIKMQVNIRSIINRGGTIGISAEASKGIPIESCPPSFRPMTPTPSPACKENPFLVELAKFSFTCDKIRVGARSFYRYFPRVLNLNKHSQGLLVVVSS